MGKKKTKGEYNDFLEDTRHSDNNEIRTTLQTTSTLSRNISPPAPSAYQPNTNPNPKQKKPPLTHFLCLPLVTPTNHQTLSTHLTKLRKDLTSLTPVPARAVRPPGTLHLTLGVMSLSPSQLSSATQHLSTLDLSQVLRGITTQRIAAEADDTLSVSENIGAVANPCLHGSSDVMAADPSVLAIELVGLVGMQGARTSVLYAQPRDGSGRLQRFAESVRGVFVEGGFVEQEERALKLHATVVNTIYAKSGGGGRGKTQVLQRRGGGEVSQSRGSGGEVGRHGEHAQGDARNWTRFDARELIDMYKDFVWAEAVHIDRVQICKMGARKIVDETTGDVVDEEYEVVAEKAL